MHHRSLSVGVENLCKDYLLRGVNATSQICPTQQTTRYTMGNFGNSNSEEDAEVRFKLIIVRFIFEDTIVTTHRTWEHMRSNHIPTKGKATTILTNMQQSSRAPHQESTDQPLAYSEFKFSINRACIPPHTGLQTFVAPLLCPWPLYRVCQPDPATTAVR